MSRVELELDFMRKSDYELLSRIFELEIDNTLPFQSKSKRAPYLAAIGLIMPMTRTFDDGPAWTHLKVEGWTLTERGRITYCEWAAKQ